MSITLEKEKKNKHNSHSKYCKRQIMVKKQNVRFYIFIVKQLEQKKVTLIFNRYVVSISNDMSVGNDLVWFLKKAIIIL